MGRTRAGAGGGMRASTTGIDVTPARGPGQCEGLLLTILLTILLIAAIHRRDFFTGERLEPLPSRPSRYHGPLVVKSVLVAAGMMALFFAGAPVPIAAIVGGALLLLTRSIKAVKVYLQIGWSLLLMFVGLFIVIAGVERAVLSPQAIAAMGRMHLASMPMLATVTAALSNLVSNVPAVLVLKPFVTQLDDPQRAWLVVAMAATLAGNFTLVGSVANHRPDCIINVPRAFDLALLEPCADGS